MLLEDKGVMTCGMGTENYTVAKHKEWYTLEQDNNTNKRTSNTTANIGMTSFIITIIMCYINVIFCLYCTLAPMPRG